MERATLSLHYISKLIFFFSSICYHSLSIQSVYNPIPTHSTLVSLTIEFIVLSS